MSDDLRQVLEAVVKLAARVNAIEGWFRDDEGVIRSTERTSAQLAEVVGAQGRHVRANAVAVNALFPAIEALTTAVRLLLSLQVLSKGAPTDAEQMGMKGALDLLAEIGEKELPEARQAVESERTAVQAWVEGAITSGRVQPGLDEPPEEDATDAESA